ncbi:MAG: electron transfer flavoprotein subunit alpha/FixB family protein [Alphaproteobacteria bacterium]|nr:electron transfer flavoprotein subunit alpha/FixB family protein [Alphaproteobacteria bacterium]
MPVLVVAEHAAGHLKRASLSAITAGLRLGEVHVLLTGEGLGPAAAAAAALKGVARVRTAEAALYAHGLAEPTAALLAGLAKDYSHVLAAASTFGKNVIPRAAALLDLQPISEVIEILDAATFVRPIYAGNALATVRSADATRLMTIRATAFAAAEETGGQATTESVATAADPGLSQFVRQEISATERPELTSARVVISGGRGMQSGENFVILERVADLLGAAVGASRAAVDAGFVPNEYQVGQTGKIVAPELYIAVGISGAIQHLAGMKDSKVIVAINKDEEAPIFQVADYGLVGDLFKIVPELADALRK